MQVAGACEEDFAEQILGWIETRNVLPTPEAIQCLKWWILRLSLVGLFEVSLVGGFVDS